MKTKVPPGICFWKLKSSNTTTVGVGFSWICCISKLKLKYRGVIFHLRVNDDVSHLNLPVGNAGNDTGTIT